MPLMNINSDRMSNASSGLCIKLILYYIALFTRVLYFASWGVIPRVRMCEGVKQSICSLCQCVSQSSEKF